MKHFTRLIPKTGSPNFGSKNSISNQFRYSHNSKSSSDNNHHHSYQHTNEQKKYKVFEDIKTGSQMAMLFAVTGGVSAALVVGAVTVVNQAADTYSSSKIKNEKWSPDAYFDGDPLIFYAIRIGQKKLFDALIKGGVNLNVKNSQGVSPLDYAISEGRPEFVDRLRKVENERHSELIRVIKQTPTDQIQHPQIGTNGVYKNIGEKL